MDGRTRRDRGARRTPARLLASLTLLALAFNAAALPQRRARTPAVSRDARAALLNPRHKFWSRRAPGVFRVRFETSKGDFVVEAHRDWAPRGADRLYNLARAGFFDDSRFFRVRAGFIAQFGIPGEPAVAAAWQNQTMPDDPVRQSNTRGFVSYAMTGPGARTTQLFINLADNSRLDKDGFAPVGRVVVGMEVVDRLYAGYGEDAGGGMRGGKQGKIFAGGNAYLDREFPLLDKLMRAVVVRPGQYRPR
jgi:peptidyl-prolyl cis-trans isomerase A (cyclophilin A)